MHLLIAFYEIFFFCTLLTCSQHVIHLLIDTMLTQRYWVVQLLILPNIIDFNDYNLKYTFCIFHDYVPIEIMKNKIYISGRNEKKKKEEIIAKRISAQWMQRNGPYGCTNQSYKIIQQAFGLNSCSRNLYSPLQAPNCRAGHITAGGRIVYRLALCMLCFFHCLYMSYWVDFPFGSTAMSKMHKHTARHQ